MRLIREMRNTALLSVAALALTACGSATSSANRARGQSPARAAAATTSCEGETSRASGGKTFNAPTYREEGSLALPVVFPDGTTADILLPPEAGVESFLPTGRVWMNLVSGSDAGRSVSVSYGSLADSLKSGDAPLECYEGSHGVVEVWASGWKDLPHWIFFPLGSWAARVGDGNIGRFLDTEERTVWASNLSATQTEGGWPVIEPTDELNFGMPREAGQPPSHEVELEFWEDGGKRGILLWPVQCEPAAVDRISHDGHGGSWFANLCFPDAPMIVHVYGEDDENFVRSLAQDLQVRDVRLAYPNIEYQLIP